MMILIGMGTEESVQRKYKGKSLMEFPTDYVVADLETTGLDPQYDQIIEIGAIRISNGQIIDKFDSLVNPGRNIPEFISNLTGITNELVMDAPPIETVLPLFLKFVQDSIVVGHNANFDINFLYDACIEHLNEPFTNNFVDTMRISRNLFRGEKHHRLRDLVDRFNIVPSVEHRALGDVMSTQMCLAYMKQYVEENGISFPVKAQSHSVSKQTKAKEIVTENTVFDETSDIFGRAFVFTGTLTRFKRKDAMQLVVDRGGLCGDSITKSTNFLVLGNSDYFPGEATKKSSKRIKAETMKLSGADIEIVSENTFYDMIEACQLPEQE